MKKQILCLLLCLILVFSLAAPVAMAGDRLVCAACGRQIPLDSSFCPYCGREVGGTSFVDDIDGAVVLYHMVHYGTQEAEEPHNRMFRDYSIYGNFKKFKARPSYGEKHFTRIVTADELEKATRFEPYTLVKGVLDHYEGFQLGTTTAYYFGDDKYVWFIEWMELILASAEAPAAQTPQPVPETLVSDAYAASCQAGGETLRFRIPQINLNSADAAAINAELYDSLYPLAEGRIAEAKQGAAEIGGLDYRCSLKGDLLSLLVDCEGGGGETGSEYRVYNLSVSTGARLGTEELLQALGLSEAAYRALVRLALENRWHQLRSAEEPGAQEALERSLAEENIDAAQPCLGPAGRLYAAAALYLPGEEASGVLLDLGLSA